MKEIPRTAVGPLTLEALARAFVLFVDSVRAVVNPALKKPILDGVLLSNVQLTSAFNPVPISHGLGRKPVGWVVVSQNYGIGLFEPDKTTRTNTLIYLQPTAVLGTNTVDLWVF